MLESCKRRGDRGCSVRCTGDGPSLRFIRNGVLHRVYGCPITHVCGTVIKAVRDYDDQKEGVLTGYAPDVIPAKYSHIKMLYSDWLAFFQRKQEERDAKPKGLSAIEAFRAAEAQRRGGR